MFYKDKYLKISVMHEILYETRIIWNAKYTFTTKSTINIYFLSDGESSDNEDSSSDWSGDEIATSANLDEKEEKWKGRPRTEVHFYNEKNEKISLFRAMIAHRSELLCDVDILNRLNDTRNQFFNQKVNTNNVARVRSGQNYKFGWKNNTKTEKIRI